jgi:hypothetical protein
MGLPSSVTLLIENGSEIEATCRKFDATPLFWVVQGFSRYGPEHKAKQLGAAQVLIDAGANLTARNCEGASILDRAGDSD